ncbi:dve-1-like isoform X1 [Octopus vulgaris]|uniref:Dve-1-like isoform X1 n=2 Tax=Octopus TaxID=6643 RepID=A0AA36B8G2_OCTVU|nr:dve-1-like isoform X1 [Octopus vulgaris]
MIWKSAFYYRPFDKNLKQPSLEDLPTLIPKEQLADSRNVQPPSTTSPPKAGVERQTGNQNISQPHQPTTSTPSTNSGDKPLPIHCIVEQISGGNSGFDSCNSHTTVEMDSYAILPGSTPMSELVQAALIKLGYTTAESVGAKGVIQLKNWKPISFETITDTSQSSIDHLLGDLTSVAILRIRLSSQPKLNSTDDVKDKLLQLLISQSHGMLLNSGCPIEKNFLLSISKGEKLAMISEERRQAFNNWYKDQLRKSVIRQNQLQKISATVSVSSTLIDNYGSHLSTLTQNSVLKTSQCVSPPSNSVPITTTVTTYSTTTTPSPAQSPPYALSHGRTRMRTSFDPEHEIPRLQRWFQQNQHPTREQMVHYLNELNSLESRKGRKQLDLTNIIYWFKNARAALRRASKNIEDSLEGEENANGETYGNADSLPYLPNRNAIYIVPHPLHSTYAKDCGNAMDMTTTSHHQEDGKPMDVSQKKSDPMKTPDASSPLPLPRTSSEENMREKLDKGKPYLSSGESGLNLASQRDSVESLVSKEENTFNNSRFRDSLESTSSKENSAFSHSNAKEDLPFNHTISSKEEEEGINHNHKKFKDEEMDCDDVDSSIDDNRSLDINSMSSQDVDQFNIVVKQEIDDSKSADSVNLKSLSGSGMTQSLQIPGHMPHGLPLHYLPYNSQYYSQLQEKSHLKSHSHSLEKKRRTRVFIDPLSEIPKLEKWFAEETHPSAYMIDKYCEELNQSEYRQKFPKLESKNVQLWFKNHRAKIKRIRLDFGDKPSGVCHDNSLELTEVSELG